MRAHPAGPLHGNLPADGRRRAAGRARRARPARLAALGRADRRRAAPRRPSVTELARTHGTPLFVLDEGDFRGRAADFADAFDRRRRPLRVEGVPLRPGGPLDRRRRPAPGRLQRQRARPGAGRRASRPSGSRCTATTSRRPSCSWPSTRGSGTSSSTPSTRSTGWSRWPPPAWRPAARPVPVLIRATVGIEAHTHEFIATAHEDQKFGFSLATGDALTAAVRVIRRAGACELTGLHSHIGSQIFDTAGFEAAAHRMVGLLGAVRAGDRRGPRRAQPRRRLRHRLPVRGRPGQPRTTSPPGCGRSSPPSARSSACPCPGWPSSPAARSPAPAPSRSTRSAPSSRCGWAPAAPRAPRWCATTSPSTAG